MRAAKRAACSGCSAACRSAALLRRAFRWSAWRRCCCGRTPTPAPRSSARASTSSSACATWCAVRTQPIANRPHLGLALCLVSGCKPPSVFSATRITILAAAAVNVVNPSRQVCSFCATSSGSQRRLTWRRLIWRRRRGGAAAEQRAGGRGAVMPHEAVSGCLIWRRRRGGAAAEQRAGGRGALRAALWGARARLVLAAAPN